MARARTGGVRRNARLAYTWDVFVSYTHSDNVAYWVRNYFHPQLRDWIRNECGVRDPRIFIDRYDIHTGDEWERKLGIALRSSICLVPVLTAEYFRSRWCRTEWKAFLAREQQVAASLAKTASGLIFPVKFSGDREQFDRSARARQIFDLSAWAYSTPAFLNSAEYLAFERAMREFVRDISHVGSVLTSPPPPIVVPVRKERADRREPATMPLPRYRSA